jgi:glycosyltransferase involved in cell wall biosynthesis
VGMADPRFSVVIPTYGRPDLLRETVASVLAQTIDDLECIVVDDAAAVPAPAFDDPRVVSIRHQENLGLSGARNTGIRAARGDYVTFVDDDDLLTPDRLEIAAEGLRRAPVAICFRGNHPGTKPGRNRILDGNVYDEIATRPVPHVGQACVERGSVLPFDAHLRAGEEVDWWLRMSRELRVATVPRVGYLFRNHAGVRAGNGSDVRWRARIDVLAMHADYFRAHRAAAAFQWRRVGLLALESGDRAVARRAFARALATRPEKAAAWHLARTMVPQRGSRTAGGAA